MEITCNRCHQPVLAENLYCSTCGLPQLVYTPDTANGEGQAERWTEAVRDASMVDWKHAFRIAVMLAIPAGLLSSAASPLGFAGLFWMAAAAGWAVVLYVRGGRGPSWVTMGAGARIGLVTGLLAAWLAFSVSGGAIFVQRYVLHRSAQIDSEWKSRVDMSQQMTQQWTSGLQPADAAEALAVRNQVQAWMQSPWGHAGIEAFGYAFNALFLLFFAVGGGALGARMMARVRRPQV
jgi:hypothetical protein